MRGDPNTSATENVTDSSQTSPTTAHVTAKKNNGVLLAMSPVCMLQLLNGASVQDVPVTVINGDITANRDIATKRDTTENEVITIRDIAKKSDEAVNGVDVRLAQATSCSSQTSSDDEAALLRSDEENEKAADKSFSDADSVGDLSLRLSDDESDECCDVPADVALSENKAEGEVAKLDVNAMIQDCKGQLQAEVVHEDESANGHEGSRTLPNGLKQKRELVGEEVAGPKRVRLASEDENVKRDKENINTKQGAGLKREATGGGPVTRGGVKKVRLLAEGSTDGDSTAKPMTNLDKAIARVATGGLTKRDRETYELLKLLDSRNLEHITGPQLDDLVKLKICEVLTQESDISKMRDRIATLEAGVEKWKEVARSTAKQLRDLELVFKKLAADGKQDNPTVLPIKITRSVGLQVGGGSLTPAQLQHVQQQQLQRKLMSQQQQQKKTPGLITNRMPGNGPPLGRPSAVRPGPPVVGGPHVGPRPPAGPRPVVPAAATRLAPNTSLTVSPGKPLTAGPNSTYPGVTRMVVGAARPAGTPPQPQVRLKPSLPPPSVGCIDLTEEDDKVTVTSAVSPAASVVNQSSVKPVIPSGIRIVPQNQLTGNPATPAGATSRLTFVVPASATGAGQSRSVLLTTNATSTQQLPGNRSVLTVGRPRLAPPQNVILGSNSVHTTAAGGVGGAGNTIVRAAISNQSTGPGRRISNVGSGGQAGRIHYRPPAIAPMRHPAPLPPAEYAISNPLWKLPPPQPELKISKCDSRQRGIILSWKMETYGDAYEVISTYQLYAYQEPTNATPATSMWKKVGDVKSMPLPMACTLTQAPSTF